MNERNPAIHNIKGVLFDFDGTLTQPGALNFLAIKREIGCPEGTPILEYLETLLPPHRSRRLKTLEVREEEAARASHPNKGAEKCLLALKQRGIPFGILTRNSLKSVHLALEKFDRITPEDFAAIITRDDALPKPHPDGVYQAARQMGISVSELVVIGDFRFDVMAGRAAQALTMLLNSQGDSVMAQGDPQPDYMIKRLEEILELVES